MKRERERERENYFFAKCYRELGVHDFQIVSRIIYKLFITSIKNILRAILFALKEIGL